MAGTAELTQISTRVDDEELRRLDQHCDEIRRSRSFVLGEALTEYMDRLADREPATTTAEAA